MHSLITLGGLSLSGADLRRPKLLLLLVYLALEGATSRRQLQSLFWNGEAGAAASLRVGLHQLRRVQPDPVTGTDVLETHVECDAVRLMDPQCSPLQVLELYTGPFLHGLEFEGISDELAEWIVAWRDRLALTAQRAGLLAAETAPSPALAARLAERVYRLPGAAPMEVEELRRLRELSAPGSSLERELLNELQDFMPLPSTSEGRGVTGTPEWDDVTVLPGLLGRRHELGVLLARLSSAPADPSAQARLMEITGPGGIGKTTLVDAALREYVAVSAGRVASVDAEAFTEPAGIADALARALGISLRDQGDAWAALGEALKGGPTVLAVHGTEHLPDLPPSLVTLLELAPDTRLIVTSRVRMTDGLHLRLSGLPLPPSGADRSELVASATVQVFLRAAQRAAGRLDLPEEAAPLVSGIVRQLDGHPLALVLAGTWTAFLSIADIHRFLLTSGGAPDFTPAPGGGSDFMPLRAVFSRSWELLTPEEQRALTWLSAFADVSTTDAHAVAGLGLPMLTRLEEHSLLRRRGDRWQIYPVLAEQVHGDPAALAEARAAHARHYLARLQGAAAVPPEDLPNVHLAVRHALSRRALTPPLVDALLALHDRGGLLSSGLEIFARLSDTASQQAVVPVEVGAGLLVSQGWLALRSARYMDAERLAARALGLIGDSDAPDALTARMKALNVQASALTMAGQSTNAMPILQEAADVAHRLGDEVREARYLANLGTLAGAAGNFSEAETFLIRAIDMHRSGRRTAYELIDRLQLLSLRADSPSIQAISLRPEADELVTRLGELGAQLETCGAQITRARLHLEDAPEQANRLAQETRQSCHALELPVLEAAAALVQSEAYYRLGQSQHARRTALQALDLCLKHQEVLGQFETWLVTAADLAVTHPALVGQALQAIRRSPQANASQRRKATEASGRIKMQGDGPTVHVTPLDPPEEIERISAQVRRVLIGQKSGTVPTPPGPGRSGFRDR